MELDQDNNIQSITAPTSDLDQRCVLRRWILTPFAQVDLNWPGTIQNGHRGR